LRLDRVAAKLALALFFFGALCRGLLSRHPALIETHLPGTWTTY